MRLHNIWPYIAPYSLALRTVDSLTQPIILLTRYLCYSFRLFSLIICHITTRVLYYCTTTGRVIRRFRKHINTCTLVDLSRSLSCLLHPCRSRLRILLLQSVLMPPRNHLPLIQGTVHVVKLVRCGESGEIWADEDVSPNSDPRKKAFTAVCLDYEGDVIDDVLNEDSA